MRQPTARTSAPDSTLSYPPIRRVCDTCGLRSRAVRWRGTCTAAACRRCAAGREGAVEDRRAVGEKHVVKRDSAGFDDMESGRTPHLSCASDRAAVARRQEDGWSRARRGGRGRVTASGVEDCNQLTTLITSCVGWPRLQISSTPPPGLLGCCCSDGRRSAALAASQCH